MFDACPRSCPMPRVHIYSVAQLPSPPQHRSNQGRETLAPPLASNLPSAMRKMKAAIVVKLSPSPTFPRSMLYSSCRANYILVPSCFIHYNDRNAAMPTTPRSVLRTAPPVTSSMRKPEETTAGRFLAPPVPPHHGDQKPSKNFVNRPLPREIMVIYPSSGQPPPPMLPSAPVRFNRILCFSSIPRHSLSYPNPLLCSSTTGRSYRRRPTNSAAAREILHGTAATHLSPNHGGC